MKLRFIIWLVLLTAINAAAQTKSEDFVERLVGRWFSTASSGETITIERRGNYLLVTETAGENAGQSSSVESRIYLDGRLQKEGLRQSVSEARTSVGKSSLTTVFYVSKDGRVKEWFRQRLSVRNDNLIIVAQIRIGVPFLAAGTKRVFQKTAN